MATDTVRDLALAPDGDLMIAGGDLALVRGPDAILQAVRIRLQFFRGEWFLDLEAGIPFYERVLVKNADPNVLRSVFRKAIEETLGVVAVTSLTLAVDRQARKLTVRFTASTDVGELTSTEVL